MFLTRWWSAEISCGLSAAFLWGWPSEATHATGMGRLAGRAP